MKDIIVVQEGDDVYNIFNRDEFNDRGYLIGYGGMEGYHIDDFDIIAEFDTLEEAI